MRNRFVIIGLVGVVVIAGALPGAGPVGADPNNDQSRIRRELAQAAATYEGASAAAQAALQAYNAATAQLPAAQDAAAQAQGVLAARHVAADQAEREAAAAHDRLATADARYAQASTAAEAAARQVGDFVAAAYRGAGLLAIGSLLESTPDDFVDRVGYLDKVAGNERAALDRYLGARAVAKGFDDAAQAARRSADAASRSAQTALAAAQAAADQAVADQQAVQNLITQRQQALDAANSQRDAVLAQYNELKAESDRIAAQLARLSAGGGARAVGSGAPGSSRGFFLTPVHGWKSSDFGMRYDPFYRVWQLHAGVDLAAPTGTPIWAAADGRVVQAGWDGGYGNYTCLYHGLYQGKGLSTCYGHQSAILVHVGEEVHRGDVIGRVGSTGASTGSHLHFEVRVDGTPVQPLNWLASCLC